MPFERIARQHRTTKETDIQLTLNLDGKGETHLDTGIGFFNHMLDGFARHGFFNLDVQVKGDLEVDTHHSIEDTGIVLGNAIRAAIQDKRGMKRYGSSILPMDETLVLCAIDLSGRPYFALDGAFTTERIAFAILPCLPMTLPMSEDATWSSMTVPLPSVFSVTATSSGLSTNAFAITSTNSFECISSFSSIISYLQEPEFTSRCQQS